MIFTFVFNLLLFYLGMAAWSSGIVSACGAMGLEIEYPPGYRMVTLLKNERKYFSLMGLPSSE
jgi:hypothetical protein